MSEEKVLTFGELLVGVSFNPSNDARVDRLKEIFAEAIDIIETVDSDKDHVNNYITHAENIIIGAQMAAVKCLFLK